MKRFQNLDWHLPLENIIDNVFINDERMEHESAMYRIMNDSFANPFEDIESEYADVDINLIKKYLSEDGEVFSDMEDTDQKNTKQKVKNKDNSHVEEQERSYVPGIRLLPFNFPKKSRLSKAQQVMCLRVLLRLCNNEKKGINDEERKELQEYMALQEIISEEQKEFLEFAKSKWNNASTGLIKCNRFIELKWKAKVQRVKKLPRFYVESINIPFSVETINCTEIRKDIGVTFTSCLREGIFSKVMLPELDCRNILYINPSILLNKYPPCVAHDKVMQHFRLPVSEDSYCETLAKETEADFVISSSGLKCLLSNINPDHSNSWFIPVVVKSYDGKKIVYVDKKLPSAIATIPQKNTWVYKYVLRHYFVNVESETSEKTEHMKEDKSEKIANHSDLDNDSFYDHLKSYEEDMYSNIDDPEKSDDFANFETDFKIDTKEQNVSYKLFTIGPTECLQHEIKQLKYDVKKYQMLVRTKTDGIEELSNKKSQSVILTPKMEHQLGLGAEAVTVEEGLHQWASLKFRPNTSLARVRIEADTSEIIQIERHTTMSLSNEIKRLYNIRVEDSLSILHNIIEGLLSLTPGQYIMRYVPQSGPFAYVYKPIENGKNIFDLHTIYQSKFRTTPTTPWLPIDNMMTTPSIRCFQRMPAMFMPIFEPQKVPGCSKGRRKKNACVTNNQDTLRTF